MSFVMMEVGLVDRGIVWTVAWLMVSMVLLVMLVANDDGVSILGNYSWYQQLDQNGKSKNEEGEELHVFWLRFGSFACSKQEKNWKTTDVCCELVLAFYTKNT